MDKFEFFTLSNPYLALGLSSLSIYFAYLTVEGERVEDLLPDASKEDLCKISKISLGGDWGTILNMAVSELCGCPVFKKKRRLAKELLRLEEKFQLVFSDDRKSIPNKKQLQQLSNFCAILSRQILLYRYK